MFDARASGYDSAGWVRCTEVGRVAAARRARTGVLLDLAGGAAGVVVRGEWNRYAAGPGRSAPWSLGHARF